MMMMMMMMMMVMVTMKVTGNEAGIRRGEKIKREREENEEAKKDDSNKIRYQSAFFLVSF